MVVEGYSQLTIVLIWVELLQTERPCVAVQGTETEGPLLPRASRLKWVLYKVFHPLEKVPDRHGIT